MYKKHHLICNKKLSYCCDSRSYCMQYSVLRSAKTTTAWYLC